MPAGPHVFKHLEDAFAECFEYHKQLDNFVVHSGLAQGRLDAARKRADSRKGRWPSAPKRFVAQEILEEIRTGQSHDDRLLAQMVDGFCRGTFSVAKPVGLNAIEALKKEREEDSRAAAEKRAARQREVEQAQCERDRVGVAKAAARDSY